MILSRPLRSSRSGKAQKVVGGIADGQALTADEAGLRRLPSREELIAKLVFIVASPTYRYCWVALVQLLDSQPLLQSQIRRAA